MSWGAIVSSAFMRAAESRLAHRESSDAAVCEFWASVGAGPLWERDEQSPDDGWCVTFLWRGETDVTRHVTLCGPLVFAESFSSGGCRFEHIAGTDIWHLSLQVPPQTRSTYAISPNGLLSPPQGIGDFARVLATWVRDPLNPSTVVIPANALMPEFTPKVYSLLEAPDAPPQRWRIPRDATARGRLEEHELPSSVLGNSRAAWTYTPAGWRSERNDHPLLLVFDGWDAVNTTHLPVVLDNLIADGAIPPVVAVLIDCGTLEMRLRELDCHEPFLTFLTDEVMPWAHARWGLVPDRSRTLVAGVSLGGRAALHAGLRRPDLIGKVIAQSPAVTETGPLALDELVGRRAAGHSETLELYLDAGLLEVDTRGDKAFLLGTRRVGEALRDAGHVVHSAELACGHDEIVVGESIADALQLLLGARRTPDETRVSPRRVAAPLPHR